MSPIHKKKLRVVLSILVGLSCAVALILYALRDSISLYYTPSQVAQNKAKPGQVFRMGGMVEKGSVEHDEGLKVHFRLTDFQHTVLVEYTGLLPDLFREGQGVVASGLLSSKGIFMAQEVLAKHDENYMPKQNGPVRNEKEN